MEPVPPVATPAAAPTAAASARYAGFWLRWVACLIDGLILSAPAIILVMFASAAGVISSGHDPSPTLFVFLFLFIPFFMAGTWLYYALLESSAEQGTLGKRLLGLRVTDQEGRRISFGRATGRYWSKILSGIPMNIGYIMAAFTERKQALHDMIAKTLVVRR